MKNMLFVILLIVVMGFAGQLLADEVEINSIPHVESFEGGTYPPAGSDNNRIDEESLWEGRIPFDEATDVIVNGNFYWSVITDHSITYSVYFSTDDIEYNLVYHGTSNGSSLENPLEYETTYYWYIEAIENGDTVTYTSDVWTFTTVREPIAPIESFPYLADFQEEDPLWFSLPLDLKGNKGGLKVLQLSQNPLSSDSNMSQDRDGLWERTLDGAANYAWVLPAGMDGGLISPPFYLVAGQTYEIKYNYRQFLPTTPMENEGLYLFSEPFLVEEGFLDVNFEVTDANYGLRRSTVVPEYTDIYKFVFVGFTTEGLYLDNFRITQNGDDVLTAAAPTVDGVATPDPAPIYNSETQEPLDTDLHIANITGSPEITARVTWTAPELGSQNTGLKLNLHASEGNLAGAVVTFIHNLGYAPLSVSYRIVPNAFSTMNNPNDGSWTSSQCIFTVPASKADGDYEVILKLSEEETLPVELSSFTAITTADYFVNLQWTTQSETNLLGFYIYRSTLGSLSTAQQVSGIISGTNSSQTTNYEYIDSEVETDNTYYYWLQSIDISGSTDFNGPVMVTINNSGDPNGTPDIPINTCLLPVYPNPFNPVATIPYQLKAAENVLISIYNTKGQLVKTYQRNHSSAGTYRIAFEGKDANGNELASGIYHCVMKAGKSTSSTKMVLLK